MHLTASVNTLFELLRAGLHPERAVKVEWCEAPDWAAVYRLATEQGVAAIAWDGVAVLRDAGQIPPSMEMPRALKLQWAMQVEQIEKRYEKQRCAIRDLVAFYREIGVDTMILKGYGLSLFYPQANHRPCGDIDTWLFGEQERADQALQERFNLPIDTEKHYHTVFTFQGVMVENHFNLLNPNSHLSNRPIERRLRALLPDKTAAIGIEEGLYIPNPDFNALFLLRHSAAHFAAAEIGLRHIIDWVMFVKHFGAQMDWMALEQFACEMNMHRFLHCQMAIAADCLGLDVSQLPPLERDDALTERALNDILHPEFAEKAQKVGLVGSLIYKTRRWWANRWKHRMVYNEGLIFTFLVQLRSHLMLPKSLKN